MGHPTDDFGGNERRIAEIEAAAFFAAAEARWLGLELARLVQAVADGAPATTIRLELRALADRIGGG